MDHDKIANVPASKASKAAIMAIDAIQDLPGAEQVMGLMAAVLCVVAGAQLNPSEVYHMAQNMMYRALQQRNEHVEALIQYTKDDLK